MALGDFRKLWLGQIFSQLADKFYIVLMVFLIDQHLRVMGGGTGVLADMASDYGLDISTRTKVITLLATGIFVANTCLLYTSPSPRDRQKSRMPSSA